VRKPLSDAALLKILETANERDLFIVGHMYIENTINQILEKKFGVPSKSIDSTLFTLNLKMDILIESNLIKGNVKKNVELLARIRKRYAHKLEPNEQRITNYIRELQYLGTAPKLAGKYAKYRVCAIRTFSALEKMLRR